MTALQRKFKYKDLILDDVPNASLKEVARVYSGTFPELLNTVPTYESVDDNGVEIYSFKSATPGTLG